MKVIYLEIVADLSAEEFFVALGCFTTRWGKLQKIILHNAPKYKLEISLVDVS